MSMSTCTPMAGNFHGEQVKFHKYQPGFFFSKSQKQIAVYGRVKDNFGLYSGSDVSTQTQLLSASTNS